MLDGDCLGLEAGCFGLGVPGRVGGGGGGLTAALEKGKGEGGRGGALSPNYSISIFFFVRRTSTDPSVVHAPTVLRRMLRA